MSKGFLYIGVAFLMMLAVIASANYLFLSKHSKSESKVSNLGIGLAKDLATDIANAVVVSGNNSVSDAMADAAYSVVIVDQNPSTSIIDHPTVSFICSRLDPNYFSEHNISKWIMDYTKNTLSSIQDNAPPLKTGYKINVSNVELSGCSADIGRIIVSFNFTYNITAENEDMYFKTNNTVSHKKTLRITRSYDSPYTTYEIEVENEDGRNDFFAAVDCRDGWACQGPV